MISQASAEQRAGRAGRQSPGVAYRLWESSTRLTPTTAPEIEQVLVCMTHIHTHTHTHTTTDTDTGTHIHAYRCTAFAHASDFA